MIKVYSLKFGELLEEEKAYSSIGACRDEALRKILPRIRSDFPETAPESFKEFKEMVSDGIIEVTTITFEGSKKWQSRQH